MEEVLSVVCGRKVEEIGAATLLELAHRYQAVLVDLGTGDGRWLYRVARVRPEVLCVGMDANADAMREVSYRAARKAARGGLPNVRFIAASVESLPAGLLEMADEIWVSYPWGSLLRAVAAPDSAVLRGVVEILKPRGVLRVAVNESVFEQPGVLRRLGLPSRPFPEIVDALRAGYSEVGLNVTAWRSDAAKIRSSWASRLRQGAGARTLWLEAVKDGGGLRTVDLGGDATTSEFTEGVIARVRAWLNDQADRGRILKGGDDGFGHVAAPSPSTLSDLSAVTGGRHSSVCRYNEESGPGR